MKRNRMLAGAAASPRPRSCSPAAPAGAPTAATPRTAATANSRRSPSSSSGSPRRSSAATTSQQANGYWEDLGLDVEIIPGAVDIVPQDVLAAGDVDFAIAWVPKALASIEAGREHHQHRADLRAQRHAAGLVGRQRHRRPRGPRRASRSAAGASATSGSSSRASPRPTPTGYTIVQQNFDMNALLNREIDAAQAMTYNEYAQLLEAHEPRDRRALPARGLHGHRLERGRHRDAPGRDLGRTPSGWSPTRSTRDTAVKLIQGAILGWIDQRDDPQAAADAVDRRRLDPRHEPPALDGQRDQQAHLAVDRAASAHINEDRVGCHGRDGARHRRTRTAHRSSPTDPPDIGIHERVRRPGARRH